MYYFVLILIILVIVVILIASNLLKKSKLKKIQRQKIAYFKKKNKLNNSELNIFKEVMKETKELINSLERNIEQSNTLKKESKIIDALKESQSIFEYLMDHPKDLIDFGDFLYKSLPFIVEASNELIQMDNIKFQSVRVNQGMEEIISMILVQAELIKVNFEQVINHQKKLVKVSNNASEIAGIQ